MNLPDPRSSTWKTASREVKIGVVKQLAQTADNQHAYDNYQPEKGNVEAFLGDALDDENPETQLAVLDAIEELGFVNCRIGVKRLLESSSEAVRQKAREVLSALDQESAEQDRLRRMPGQILSDTSLDNVGKIEHLKDLLGVNRPEVRAYVIMALSSIDNDQARKVITDASREDSSIIVRTRAHESLLEYELAAGEKSATEVLRGYLTRRYATGLERDSLADMVLQKAGTMAISEHGLRSDVERLAAESDTPYFKAKCNRLLFWMDLVRTHGETGAAKEFIRQQPEPVFQYDKSYEWAHKALQRSASKELVPFLIEQGQRNSKSTAFCRDVLFNILAPEYRKAKEEGNQAKLSEIEDQLKQAGAEYLLRRLE